MPGRFEAFRTKLTAVPGVVEALARVTTPSCVASSGTHERLRHAAGGVFSSMDELPGLLARTS